MYTVVQLNIKNLPVLGHNQRVKEKMTELDLQLYS